MRHCWLGILLLFLLSACSNNQEQKQCYHVIKDDLTESIAVSGTIQAEHTTNITAPRMFLATIIWVEEDGKHVEIGDTICILEHSETESELVKQEEEKKKLEAQLNKLVANHQVQIALLQAELENNDIQLSITSLDSAQKQFAPPLQQKLISLQQQKANIQKEKLEKKFAARKTIGDSEIRSLKSRIKVTEGRIERSQDLLNQLIITAPKSGIMMLVEAPEIMFSTREGAGSAGGKVQKGATTFPNMSIIEIPNLSKMQVLADLTETDYKKVQKGQKVQMLVEAKNNLVTTGTILRKMLTGKQRNHNSKVKYYEALIEVDSCHSQLTPGMNAECNIVINEYKDTIIVPAVSVFEENEEKFVYVLKGKKYRKTPVKTGNASTTFCIITEGISNDTYIALSRPPAGKILQDRHSANVSIKDTKTVAPAIPGTDSTQTELLNKSDKI